MENSPVIEVKNAEYRYKLPDGGFVAALSGVSLSISAGEFVVICGHNGSGKSTLAKLMNGLLLPTNAEGEVLVKKMKTTDAAHTFDIRRSAGIVFQNPDNQMVATFVEDDLAFGPENLGVPREEIEERIDWSLAAVGMSGHRKSTPFKMSGGQKQRIAIAAVLAMKPEILILDESTSMLDPKGRREVMNTLLNLNKSGITVILITHNMDEAFFASRAVILKDGQIKADAPPEDIFSDYNLLIENSLTLPAVPETARLLREKGLDVEPAVFFVEDLAEELCRLL